MAALGTRHNGGASAHSINGPGWNPTPSATMIALQAKADGRILSRAIAAGRVPPASARAASSPGAPDISPLLLCRIAKDIGVPVQEFVSRRHRPIGAYATMTVWVPTNSPSKTGSPSSSRSSMTSRRLAFSSSNVSTALLLPHPLRGQAPHLFAVAPEDFSSSAQGDTPAFHSHAD